MRRSQLVNGRILSLVFASLPVGHSRLSLRESSASADFRGAKGDYVVLSNQQVATRLKTRLYKFPTLPFET